MKTPKISIIASLDEENGIGFGGKIPWYVPEDLKWFKEKTMGHVVLMGSKTFESIFNKLKKPLPGRTNIIITKQKHFKYDGVLTADSLEKGINLARKKEKNGEIFIIGGGQIYNQTINLANRLYLTKVKGKHGADTFFPNYAEFDKVVFLKSGKSGVYRFEFRILER
jgi:dihydrofolate reductase